MTDARLEFIAAMRADGLDPPTDFDVDDLTRCGLRKRCWFIYHENPRPHGAYGDWSTGLSVTWSSSNRSSMSPVERGQLLRQIAAERRQRDEQRNREQRTAKEFAQAHWAAAGPVGHHPYLANKLLLNLGVDLGIRQRGPHLLIPLVNGMGEVWSYQTIAQNGDKRFLKGARKAGLYCPIGWPDGGKLSELYICEGWATGAAVHLMTGSPVAAAMDAGNLLAAAQTIRTRWPHLPLSFCADHDGPGGGIGLACAIAAAESVRNARVIKPQCADDAHIDFADAWVEQQQQQVAA